MIRCHLSTLLGTRKLKVAEVARDTGINKNTLHRLYNETATRVDLDVIDKLCDFLNVGVQDLFEKIDETERPG